MKSEESEADRLAAVVGLQSVRVLAVMKAALSNECRNSERQTVVVAESGALPRAISTRAWGQDRTPVILGYGELERVREFVRASRQGDSDAEG